MAYNLGPMLAGKFEEHRIRALLNGGHKYLIAQPKIEGFRFINWEGTGMSRSWKQWTNRYLQRWCGDWPQFHGMDGEFFVGLDYDPLNFRDALSGGKSEDGARELGFYWFDNMRVITREMGYEHRRDVVQRIMSEVPEIQETPNYKVRHLLIPSEKVKTLDQIYELESKWLDEGHEGIILRHPDMPYKFGRGTPTAGPLWKKKQFDDFEALIIGWEPRYHNANELLENELGYAHRTQHQENLVAEECMGAFICRELDQSGKPIYPEDITFKVGVFKGVSMAQKEQWWKDREQMWHRIIKCKRPVASASAGYDKPRTAVFYSFRNPTEIG